MDASTLQLIIPIAGVVAVLFALYLARDVLSRDKGTQAMQDVGDMIREGADAFIKRQYTTIGVLAVVGAVVIGLVITLFEGKEVADTNGTDDREDRDGRVLAPDERNRALEDRAGDVLHRLGAGVPRKDIAGEIEGKEHGRDAGDGDDQLERARIHRARWSSSVMR